MYQRVLSEYKMELLSSLADLLKIRMGEVLRYIPEISVVTGREQF